MMKHKHFKIYAGNCLTQYLGLGLLTNHLMYFRNNSRDNLALMGLDEIYLLCSAIMIKMGVIWGIYPVFDVLLQASECRVCQFHKHYTFSCIWFGGYGQFLSLQQDCHSWPAERRPTHTAGLRPRRRPPGREARAD